MQKNLINLKKYLLIIIGFIIIIVFIWNRVLRERLPRDIPFNLSWVYLLILIIIISIHLYVIYNFIRKHFKLHVLNSYKIDKIYIPLILFDTFLKERIISEKTTKKLILLLIKYSDKSLAYSRSIYFLWHIFQILVPLMLFIDVFYLKKITLFYKTLWLLLFPLIYKYLQYSLDNHYKRQCDILDQHIAIQWDNPPSYLILEDEDHIIIDTNTYIEKSTLKKPNESFQTSFSLYIHYMTSLNKRLNIDTTKYRLNFAEILSTEVRVFHTLQSLFTIKYNYTLINNQWKPLIDFTKSILYVICWGYILFISYPSLYNASFESLWAIQDITEPFSLTNLTLTHAH